MDCSPEEKESSEMKIGFCGAGGTGKSTTAKMLQEATGYPLRISPSRAVFALHGCTTEDQQALLSPEGRYDIQREIFARISAQVQENGDGIFERTPIDNFFYLLFRCHDIATEHDIRTMHQSMVRNMLTFDLIVFFPLYDWKPKADGMRTQSLAARMLTDMGIGDLIKRCGISPAIMPNTSPDDRLTLLRSLIQTLTGRYSI